MSFKLYVMEFEIRHLSMGNDIIRFIEMKENRLSIEFLLYGKES